MHPKVTQVCALLAAVGLVFAASRFTPQINAERAKLDQLGKGSVAVQPPPEYAFAVQALGAFRGLITNIAFIRAEEFKNQGRYYDAMQLATWICQLQPRFPGVWEFQSWNMAWNISVTTYTPEERWNWVYNGAKLLRDEGIAKYNRGAVNLYKQLAWIFQNKMGSTVDEFHETYKKQWAYRMHLVLGAPPDPFGDYTPGVATEQPSVSIGSDALAEALKIEGQRRRERRAQDPDFPKVIPIEGFDPSFRSKIGDPMPGDFAIVTQARSRWLRRIADAPQTLEALYQAHPAAADMVRQLRELGASIRDEPLSEERYWDLESGLAFTFFYRWRVLTDPPSMLGRVRLREGADPDAAAIQRFDEILGVRAGNPDGEALLRFLQRKVLTEVYRLDPGEMAHLVELFGPMDFRLVEAQALYWVNQGLIAGAETISDFTNDKTNTTRLIFFCLRDLFLHNKLTFQPNGRNPNDSYINFNVDLNFIEPMHRAYLTYGKEIDPDPEATGIGGTFRTGHVNFLTDAICWLYFAGRLQDAAHYYEYLRSDYFRTTDGKLNPALAKPLRDYVMDSFRENFGQIEVRYAVAGLLGQALDNLADGNLSLYTGQVAFAADLHGRYNTEHADDPSTKMLLPPFANVMADSVRFWFQRIPHTPADAIRKVWLWNNLAFENRVRQAVYDDLKPIFEKECELFSFDLAKAYPEPPGMEAYRAQHARPPSDADEADPRAIETPVQAPG